MTGRQYESPYPPSTVWEPEPLHVPEPPRDRGANYPSHGGRGDQRPDHDDDDRPGTHVIVIDLA